jgi:hypothetical protein
LSSIIKSSLIDWNCLCGQAQERYFFFAIVFLLILVTRQLDTRKPLLFKIIFSAVLIVVVLNMASGFFIPIHAEENWKYVTKLYDPSGKYPCYIGELPNWSITIPCTKPVSNNMTMVQSASSTGSGPSITFTPPVQPTVTSIVSNSSSVKFGQSITFTAIISPTPDYGEVQFYIDGIATGKPVTIFAGQAIFSTFLPVGSHHIYASYLGAPNFNAGISGNMTVTVLSASNS